MKIILMKGFNETLNRIPLERI